MEPNFFQYGVVAFIFSANLLITQSNSRYLRPSDHGLAYQQDSPPPTPNDDAQEMLAFFGNGTTSSLPLPEARNISGTWWNEDESQRSRDIRRDHLKIGLLLASAVCGLAGVVLLVVSGIVFLFRIRKEEKKTKKDRIWSRSGPTSEAEVAHCK